MTVTVLASPRSTRSYSGSMIEREMGSGTESTIRKEKHLVKDWTKTLGMRTN